MGDMAEYQIVLMVLAVNACVLGIVFFAAYRLNKAARRSGR
jgi:fructose-specific phosphotransferase system component IIB